MRLAAGLLLPDSGSIEVLGIDVVSAPLQAQSAVGYMPQRFGLYEDLSVQENLDLYADLQGVSIGAAPGTLRGADAHDRAGPLYRAVSPDACPAA